MFHGSITMFHGQITYNWAIFLRLFPETLGHCRWNLRITEDGQHATGRGVLVEELIHLAVLATVGTNIGKYRFITTITMVL